MPLSATEGMVRCTRRAIKGLMNFHPEGWDEVQERGRQVIRRLLERRMRQRVRGYLEQELSSCEQDRRNGYYRRHLLASMGDIELAVPRTRRWSAFDVVQAYARRAPDVDRCILACFVYGLSTRKVSEAPGLRPGLTGFVESCSPAGPACTGGGTLRYRWFDIETQEWTDRSLQIEIPDMGQPYVPRVEAQFRTDCLESAGVSEETPPAARLSWGRIKMGYR